MAAGRPPLRHRGPILATRRGAALPLRGPGADVGPGRWCRDLGHGVVPAAVPLGPRRAGAARPDLSSRRPRHHALHGRLGLGLGRRDGRQVAVDRASSRGPWPRLLRPRRGCAGVSGRRPLADLGAGLVGHCVGREHGRRAQLDPLAPRPGHQRGHLPRWRTHRYHGPRQQGHRLGGGHGQGVAQPRAPGLGHERRRARPGHHRRDGEPLRPDDDVERADRRAVAVVDRAVGWPGALGCGCCSVPPWRPLGHLWRAAHSGVGGRLRERVAPVAECAADHLGRRRRRRGRCRSDVRPGMGDYLERCLRRGDAHVPRRAGGLVP
mmetsp:Transcript_16550/g.48010  ORF Transcript_16550/g.48010 Transcript_16550/m.48010 type:complete len:322 (+) Transcript_16550:319-1284(+)